MDYIKDSIENAIRAVLPMSFILKTYLEDKRKKEIVVNHEKNSSIENLSKLSDKEPIIHTGGNQLNNNFNDLNHNNYNEINHNNYKENVDKLSPVNNNSVEKYKSFNIKYH